MKTKTATIGVAPFSSGEGLQGKYMTQTSPPQHSVALIQEDARGLRATGAFDRFDVPFEGDAKPGDLFQVKLGETATPLTYLGRPSSVPSVISALALHAGELQFSEAQEKEAKNIAEAATSYPRKDLRKLPTFTIDGEHTKDFDDAISAHKEGNQIRVWVHVADVSAYVRPGTKIDLEARRRATSVYLPTMTVPMLPRVLSTGVCSLVPGEDRAAVTCELLLEDGEVISRSFYRSLIRSDARLTYSHVEDIFLGKAEPGPTYAAALAAARQAAIDRYSESVERNHEPVFKFSNDEVAGITFRPEEESQKLIERLMVLANQEVARFLAEKKKATLYRVHAEAELERVTRLLERLKSLGVKVKEPTLEAAVEAVDDYEDKHGNRDGLQELLWGARAPALYSPELSAHSGLDIATYCHFTSPIRRYADLMVHRALLSEIGAEKKKAAAKTSELEDLALHLNERNRAVKKLSRRADDICYVSLLRYKLKQSKIERTLPGIISGMSQYGCYVKVDCAEGMLSGRDLGGEPNTEHTLWQTNKRRLRLGEKINVNIRNLDPVRGQLRLTLV